MLPSFKCFAVFMFSAQNIPSSQSVHSFRDAAPSKERLFLQDKTYNRIGRSSLGIFPDNMPYKTLFPRRNKFRHYNQESE